ncbi:MAG: type II toxin-antitoxin system RelE family toxin [Candidatus Baldrarchaeia archaeon]
MMSYNVLVNKRILKASKHLSESHKKKLIEILDVLRTNSIPSERFDVKNLKISKFFRIRIGDYRLIYALFKEEKL